MLIIKWLIVGTPHADVPTLFSPLGRIQYVPTPPLGGWGMGLVYFRTGRTGKPWKR